MAGERSSPTVLAALPRALLEVAAELGHDAGALRDAAGLTTRDLGDPDGRIPLRRHLGLWIELCRLGPTIGLDIGGRLGLRALGLVGFIVEHRATLGEAMQEVARFRRLVLEDAVPRLFVRPRASGREAVLVQTLPVAVARLGRPAEAQAAASIAAVRWLLGSDLPPIAVSFQHPAPEDPEVRRAHERVFRVRPSFGAPRTEVVFDAAWLDAPNRRQNPALADYASRRAGMLAANLGAATWAERVRAILDDALQDPPTPHAVARDLGTSARTLQRRLADEATSFADILDRARHDRALALLENRDRTAGEVAFALGFRVTATFFRAFRRWTGLTPGEHRMRAVPLP